jgi:hypothetical protein
MLARDYEISKLIKHPHIIWSVKDLSGKDIASACYWRDIMTPGEIAASAMNFPTVIRERVDVFSNHNRGQGLASSLLRYCDLELLKMGITEPRLFLNNTNQSHRFETYLSMCSSLLYYDGRLALFYP